MERSLNMIVSAGR